MKQNVNLVLEYLDTDLEAIIKEKSLTFQQGDIKSWMSMTLRGLEYIHRSGVLHRVMFTYLDSSCADGRTSSLTICSFHPPGNSKLRISVWPESLERQGIV